MTRPRFLGPSGQARARDAARAGRLKLHPPAPEPAKRAGLGVALALGFLCWIGAAYLFGLWMGSGGTQRPVTLDCQAAGRNGLMTCFETSPDAVIVDRAYRARRIQ